MLRNSNVLKPSFKKMSELNSEYLFPGHGPLIKGKKEITKVFPKYSLTEGLNEKIYRNIIYRVLQDFDASDEWYSDNFLKENNFSKLQKVLLNLHNPSTKKDLNSNDYRRLVYDEIFSNLIYLSTSRKIVRTKKKIKYLNKNKISKVYL